MQCKCGYCFSKEMLRAMQADEKSPYVSYLVVRDEDYQAFLCSEIEVLNVEDKESEAWFEAIARSSEMAGSLVRCPKCARLVLNAPDADDFEHYVAER